MNDSESRAALASLSGPMPVADVEALQAQHERVRPQLRKFVRGLPARRKKQRLLRVAAACGGMALCAGLVLAAWHWQPTGQQAFIVEQGRASVLEGGHRVATDAKETVTLRTRYGARIDVAAASRLEASAVGERHEQVVLTHGSVRVQVPHLDPGGTFSVKTPDAMVTVHGTAFTVAVSGGALNPQTCVRVTEGAVSVARAGAEFVLKAGEQFNCVEATPSVAAALPSAAHTKLAPPTSLEPSMAREKLAPSPTARGSAAGASVDGTLSEQNGLLASALRAERAGRYSEAESRLRELITRYPSSALLPDAQRSLNRVQRVQRALPHEP